MLGEAGIYTILDCHQDVWSPKFCGKLQLLIASEESFIFGIVQVREHQITLLCTKTVPRSHSSFQNPFLHSVHTKWTPRLGTVKDILGRYDSTTDTCADTPTEVSATRILSSRTISLMQLGRQCE